VKRVYLTVILFACLHSARSQADTTYLKALYDRCLDFNEDKADSVFYYAEFIDRTARALKFEKGDVLSLRLKGYYQELRDNYEEAIAFHLQALEAARKIKGVEYEISSLSDLAIVYTEIKNPVKAKEFYVQCAALVAKKGDISSIVSTYANLGVIYNHLGMYDSALYVLNEGLRVAKPVESKLDLSSLYNNLGNVYFRKQQYDRAFFYFQNNYNKHIGESNLADWWIDNLNIADVFIEQKKFDSAQKYAEKALRLAIQLDSRSKESDSYSLLAKLNERKGNYRQAYIFLKKWYTLDTAIVNVDTYKTIAELQERFHARDREAQNKLLQIEIERQKAWSRELTTIAVALAISGTLAAIAFFTKRNSNRRLKATNELIVKQNEKLEELHYEKNSLIGIVSHDLSTPFATIKMWGQLLKSGEENLDEEQKKAVQRILQASEYGDQFIRSILDVEKADIGAHKIHLENFNLNQFVLELVENFRAVSEKKDIRVHVEMPGSSIFLMSDKQLVGRIISNLLSNAIKYTPTGKNIWLGISEENSSITISVKDEGVGIRQEELPFLFSKYSKLSSKPTDGEPSTGLGLSIVKKLTEELNGRIYCESQPGSGSVFYVVMAK
jgi:signal transduction histidine kinase